MTPTTGSDCHYFHIAGLQYLPLADICKTIFEGAHSKNTFFYFSHTEKSICAEDIITRMAQNTILIALFAFIFGIRKRNRLTEMQCPQFLFTEF